MMLICYCLGVFNGCSLHLKKFLMVIYFYFFHAFFAIASLVIFLVQEFILEDDIANEALGPSNCVLGLNTPSTTLFFVPNATFVGVVLGPKRPFIVAIFLSLGKVSIV